MTPTAPKATIFDVVKMHDAIDDALFTSEGVVTPAIEALITAHAFHEREMVDRYAAIIRDHEVRSNACRARGQALLKRATAIENVVAGRKALLKWLMERKGLPRLEGVESNFRIQNKGGYAPIIYIDADGIPDQFRKPIPPVPPKGEIDEAKLRTAIQAGDEVACKYAKLGDRGKIIVLA